MVPSIAIYPCAQKNNCKRMLNRIDSVELEYLKPLNCVQKLNYWYSIEILGTVWLSAKE